MTKILLTGAGGYIGTHLASALKEKGIDYLGVDDFSNQNSLKHKNLNNLCVENLSILNHKDLRSLIQNYRPTTIVHLAACKTIAVSENESLFEKVNVIGTQNILSIASEYEIKRFIFASTAAVYTEKLDSQQYVEDDLTMPSSQYGMSKLKSEENLRKWSEETNSQSIAFRFFNVAGGFAGGIPESLGSNLIPRIFQCISTGQEIEIYGNDWSTPDGFAIRDYVHIRDIVDAILISISNLERSNLNRGMFEVMNLGTGNGYSVMEVIDAIGRLNLGKIRHRIRPRRVGEVGFAVSNPTYGYHLMGIKCARDLNEMVQDYAELLRNT